jgi:integrase
MKTHTVGRALRLWEKSAVAGGIEDPNVMKYLKTALKKYVAPELDKKTQSLTPTEFARYCEGWDIAQLKNALKIFDCQFDAAVEAETISKSTKGNYRSALGRFMNWVEQQTWWQEIFLEESVPPRAPKLPPRVNVNPIKKEVVLYGLPKSEAPEALKNQLERYKQFRLTGNKLILENPEERKLAREQRKLARENNSDGNFNITRSKAKITTVLEESYSKEETWILMFLGWCLNEEKMSLDELCLELLTDPDLIDDYNNWSIQKRENCHSMGEKMVYAGIAIAKWLNYGKSKRRNWSDIPIITELQDLGANYDEEYTKEKKQNEARKWPKKKLTHEQARLVVQEARNYCSYRDSSGNVRNLASVAKSWQTYLIIKFLVYCPVRQKEIRNLKINETIFRRIDVNGRPYYEVLIKGKDFSKTGVPRNYRLPSILTKDIEIWSDVWLPKIKEVVETPDKWTNFWGFSLKELEEYKQQLEIGLAEEKIPEISVKKRGRSGNYLKNLESKVRGWDNRFNSRVTAQENLEKYNGFLFPSLGSKRGKNYGKPLSDSILRSQVVEGIKKVTRARPEIFGTQKETNPHAFRHIAEKHIRKVRPSEKGLLGKLIGHSERVGDEYADQITTEYELTEKIVDDWWEEI